MKKDRKMFLEKMFLVASWKKRLSYFYGNRQRTKLAPIDIMYKPVKKWDHIIVFYFSIDLAGAYRDEWSKGKILIHSTVY